MFRELLQEQLKTLTYSGTLFVQETKVTTKGWISATGEKEMHLMESVPDVVEADRQEAK